MQNQPLATVKTPMTLQAGHGQAQLESLLALEANWTGLQAMASKGAVPRLPPALRELALAEATALDVALASTAKADHVAAGLYALQGHYWQAGMSEALMRQVAADYVRLLSGYPVAAYEAARDACLLDEQRKFFPKVGEFKRLLDNALHSMKWRRQKLAALLDGGE